MPRDTLNKTAKSRRLWLLGGFSETVSPLPVFGDVQPSDFASIGAYVGLNWGRADLGTLSHCQASR